MTDMELFKEAAIAQYLRRVKVGQETVRVDNGSLDAGQPMFFYCKSCGIPTECLPEDYLFPPHRLCSQCDGLDREGLLTIAERAARAVR